MWQYPTAFGGVKSRPTHPLVTVKLLALLPLNSNRDMNQLAEAKWRVVRAKL
jgi:hypothetical protein